MLYDVVCTREVSIQLSVGHVSCPGYVQGLVQHVGVSPTDSGC